MAQLISPGQNGRHFADNIFKCIFLNEKIWILCKISLKIVPKGPIDNDQAPGSSIGFDNGLAPNRRQAIIWTYVHPIFWCIYVALGGDELKIGHQDSSTSSDHQGDIPHSLIGTMDDIS